MVGGTNVMLDAATMAGICQLQVRFLSELPAGVSAISYKRAMDSLLLTDLTALPTNAGTLPCGPLQVV